MKITIDRNGKTTPTDFSWQFGMGNDHAALTLRTDMLEHLRFAHDELGTKYVRFHGIFDDDLYVYQSLADNGYMGGLLKAKQVGRINFHHVAKVFDNVLKAGLKPFVELSFMPKRLASGGKIGFKYFHYNNNVTMPKSIKKWQEFITEFMEFIVNYYGKEEIESWYFEVWNEPDLSIFFKGKQKDYFKLYKATVEAIKVVDSNVRVGGPSTSACRWVDDFVSYCETNNVPYDFVSTHHYPGDGFGNSFGIKQAFAMMGKSKHAAEEGWTLGKTFQELFFNKEISKQWSKGILADFDKQVQKEANGKPIFISEWNSMAVFGAPIHDEKYSAAFVAKTAIDLNHYVTGNMFWCVSDLFEEQIMIGDPFHGSFGIINNNGIPKPNFWAFKILSMLHKDRLDIDFKSSEVDCAAYTNGKDIQVLLTPQSHDVDKIDSHNVELEIPLAAKSVTVYKIDDTHCNPKQVWTDLGSPQYIKPDQVELIKQQTKLVGEKCDFVVNGDTTTIKVSIQTNDVVLFDIKA